MTIKPHAKLALAAAKNLLSSQTGYVHLYYQKRPYVKGDTIALYHNFLYALALCKSYEKNEVLKAIALLKKLLIFQTANGNFVQYLHQYPVSERRFEVVDCLLPLFYIYKDFEKVLGKDLKEQLKSSIEKSLNYLLEQVCEPFSYLLECQIYSLFQAYGNLFKDANLEKLGKEKLEQLSQKGPQVIWASPRYLSRLIPFLHLNIENLSQSLFKDLHIFLLQSYHIKTKSYVGPAIGEFYSDDSAEKTLYHIYMSKELKGFDDSTVLESVLLDFSDQFDFSKQKKNYQLSFNDYHFLTYLEDHFAYSTFNLEKYKWEKIGGNYPFKLTFLDENKKVQTLVLQMGSFTKVVQKENYLLHFSFEKDTEIDASFFWNNNSNLKAYIDGQKASCFKVPACLQLKSEVIQFDFSFQDTPVDNSYWGQLMHQNRSSQLDNDMHSAFDHRLYFREAVHKDDNQLILELKINSES